MIETYKKVNISVEYKRFCTKPSEEDSFFQIGLNESKEWYAMIETYKNVNISVEYQQFCAKPSEQGSVFLTSQNLQKCKYPSGISMVLHETQTSQNESKE